MPTPRPSVVPSTARADSCTARRPRSATRRGRRNAGTPHCATPRGPGGRAQHHRLGPFGASKLKPRFQERVAQPASRRAGRAVPARPARPRRAHPSSATQPRHPNRRDHLRGPGRGRRQPRRAARAAGATLTKEPTDAEFFEGRDAYPPTRKAAAGRSPGPRTATPLWRPPAEPPANPPEPQHVPGTCAHFVQRRIAQPPRPFTVYSAIARSKRGQVRTAAITAGSRSTGSTDPRGGKDPPSCVARPAYAMVAEVDPSRATARSAPPRLVEVSSWPAEGNGVRRSSKQWEQTCTQRSRIGVVGNVDGACPFN
jgi:hypothetical protein